MTKSPLRSSAGFTYIAALVMVVIMGIMASQAAELWSTKMKREREVELLYRGRQVRDALRRWYKIKVPVAGSATGGSTAPASAAQTQLQGASPQDLKALLSASGLAKVRYLRPSSLVDPITLKEWALVKDASQRIIGVASTSEAEPLKQANFPLDLVPADFEGKKKYSDWQFICNKFPPPPGSGGVKGLGGTSNPGTSTPGGATGMPGGATGTPGPGGAGSR